MKNKNLFDLIQNPVVGVIALQSFTLGYNNVAKHKTSALHYPTLDQIFYVLPIVYHRDSLVVIKSSNELYTALIKNTSITLGLQERANKMSPQTLDSLGIAFSKKILALNMENYTIELLTGFKSKKMPLTLSMNTTTNSIKLVQDCAYKLGSMFAKRNEKNIQLELNIRF